MQCKNIVSVLVICLSMIAAFSPIAFAATDLGILSYWHSDGDRIARWNESSVDVYVNKFNSNGYFCFAMGISKGCDKWDEVINLTVNYSLLYTSALIQYHGIGVAEWQIPFINRNDKRDGHRPL